MSGNVDHADSNDLLAIQATLRADRDGSARQALQGKLEELRHTLKRRMDAGVSPAEYRKLSTLADAAAAADEVLGNEWRRHHGAAGA